MELKFIYKLVFYTIIISLMISFYVFLHELGHALFAWFVGAKVKRINLYGFGIWYFFGECFIEKTAIGQSPIVSLGGHVFSFYCCFPLYLYYKWKWQKNLWMQFTVFVVVYKEIFYIAVSPLIRNGDMWDCINYCLCMYGWEYIGYILLGLSFSFIYVSVVLFIKYLTIFSGTYKKILLNKQWYNVVNKLYG